ncbi:MAG: PEP-CTERM sorting domain-containing protein [Candidatus Omnitrophica bacterium]|nr:PEP-CTERM sorting domain-containing protein [Candidatus Omnitrophota bacterium]
MLTDNLIAYWTMDEAGGTRFDSAGSNHLMDNNTVTQAIGKMNFAGQFTSANNEYLSLADNADLSTGDIDFTCSVWVYLDKKDVFKSILSKGQLYEYLLEYTPDNDQFRFAIENGSAAVLANSFGVPAIDTWNFVVFWHDVTTNTINIQVNDGAVDSNADTTIIENANPFYMGWAGVMPDNHMDGRIDEVRFWKRLLSAEERTGLYKEPDLFQNFVIPEPSVVLLFGASLLGFIGWRRSSLSSNS